MDTEYFVYVYLDPRKRGNYTYDKFTFEYEPFYVGKGKDYREKRHLTESNFDGTHKSNLIKKLLNNNKNPIIKKVRENLTEDAAFKLEKKFIKDIGRIDKGNGTLTNKTDGGEGISGYKFSKEQREYLSSIKQGKLNNRYGISLSMETKRKIGNANKGKTWKHDKERVEEFSKLKSKQYSGNGNPFYGKTHTQESLNKIRKQVEVYDYDTKEKINEYNSATKCADDLNIPIGKVSVVANGKKKHYKRMVFVYK